jgi:SAM-dependent methyltransferase
MSGQPSFEKLAEHFIRELSVPGDLVLDPFAGAGTTIAVARRLGRRGLGVEIVPDLVAEIRARLGEDAVVAGDSRNLAALDLPTADLVVTSPPFMTRTDHPQNPLSGYLTLDGDYGNYPAEVAGIVAALGQIVRPGGHIVLDVWNFEHSGELTPLADDVADAIELPLAERVKIKWDHPTIDDICLVYRAIAVGEETGRGG